MRLGGVLGIIDPGYAQRVIRLLRAYGYCLRAVEVDSDRILSAMQADKKRSGDELRFVVQRGLEQTELRAVPMPAVRAALRGVRLTLVPTTFDRDRRRRPYGKTGNQV